MAKLKLIPDPTFKTVVQIPVPGGEPAPVEFTFKHRDRAAVKAWVETVGDQTDAQMVESCIVGWDLDDELNADNIKRLCDNYVGTGVAVFSAYLDELRGARAKN
jgi:hypothetical protein